MKTIEKGLILNDRYELVTFIGKGGFSQVWLAKDMQTSGKEVAMKIFVSNSGLTDEELETFRDEYENTRGLNDDRLLTPSDHFDYGNSPCLVMPYMQGGSLENKIRKQGRLSEEEIAQILLQIGGGLQVLESHQILHNDIKPDNMLIDGGGNYHLADFGISAKMRNTFLRASRLRGETFNYRSPEKIQGNDVNAQSDIFSLGVTLYEVCRGIFPEGVSLGDNVIKEYPKPSIDTEYYSRRLEQLIHACLNRHSQDRPTAAKLEAYARHFATNGYWDEISEYIPEAEYVRRTVPRSSQEQHPSASNPSHAISTSSTAGSEGNQPLYSPIKQSQQSSNAPGSGSNTFRIAMGALAVVAMGFVGLFAYDQFSSKPPAISTTSSLLPEQPSNSDGTNPVPVTPQPVPQESTQPSLTEKKPPEDKNPVVPPVVPDITTAPDHSKDKNVLTEEQAKELFQKAYDLYTAEEYGKSISLFNQYISAKSGDWRGYYYRGSAHLALKHFNNAISDLSTSINLEPNECGLYANRGLAYHQAGGGNLNQTLADYKKATDLGCNGTFNNYGFALYDAGDYANAKKAFAKSLKEENNPDTNIGMAITCYKLEDYDKAKSYLERATQLESCFGLYEFESCVKGKYWYTREQVEVIHKVQKL